MPTISMFYGIIISMFFEIKRVASGSGLATKHFIDETCGMARPLRIELAGGFYHVTSRGDRREDIYLNQADREAWLDLLGYA